MAFKHDGTIVINDAGVLSNIDSVDATSNATLVNNLNSIPNSFTIYANNSARSSGTQVDGQMAYIIDGGKLQVYDSDASQYYTITTASNVAPTITGNLATYAFLTGSTSTIVTITGTDPNGDLVTLRSTTDAAFDAFASVTQDSSQFTISITDTTANASGNITFHVSDGIDSASTTSAITFTIVTNFAVDRVETGNFTVTHTPFKTKLGGDSISNPKLWMTELSQYTEVQSHKEFPFDHINNVLYAPVVNNKGAVNSYDQTIGLAKIKFDDDGTVTNLWVTDSLPSSINGTLGMYGGYYYPGESAGDGHVVLQSTNSFAVLSIKDDDTGIVTVNKKTSSTSYTRYNIQDADYGKFNPFPDRTAWLGANDRLLGTPSTNYCVLRNAPNGWKAPLNSTNFYGRFFTNPNRVSDFEWIDADHFIISGSNGTIHNCYVVYNWHLAEPTVTQRWQSGTFTSGNWKSNGERVYYITGTNVYEFDIDDITTASVPTLSDALWYDAHNISENSYFSSFGKHNSGEVTSGGDIWLYTRDDTTYPYYFGVYLAIDNTNETITTKQFGIGSPGSLQTIQIRQITLTGYCNGHFVWGKNYAGAYRQFTQQSNNIDSPGIFSAF
jgi:hypothetical protein